MVFSSHLRTQFFLRKNSGAEGGIRTLGPLRDEALNLAPLARLGYLRIMNMILRELPDGFDEVIELFVQDIHGLFHDRLRGEGTVGLE